MQQAFYDACMERGYAPNHDLNGPDSGGIGAIPMNNRNGWRMSTNVTHLTPARHRLNLTIRGGVFVRRVVIEDGKVAGVEAESGGEIFTVEADRVVLCAGALKSPHILMLSGVGPREQLEQHGVPVLVDSPGVGQNLFNHPMGSVTFRVNEDVKLTANAEALRFGLRVTSEPPSQPNDVMLHSLSIWNVMTGEMVPSGTARIACALELPDGSGWVRLQSGDPAVQPSINYRYLHNENDMRRMRDAVRLACGILESGAYRGISGGRIAPDDETLADDDALDAWIRQTLGSSRHVSGTCPHRAGGRRHGGHRPAVPGARRQRPVGSRLLHHAPGYPRQHQRHRHHDWRARRRLGGRGLFTTEDTEDADWIVGWVYAVLRFQ